MGILSRVGRRVKQMINGQSADLAKWQSRFNINKNEYDNEIAEMAVRDEIYNGTRAVTEIDGKPAKKSDYVRNVVAEIIEAEVDSSIPLPKVRAKRQEDEQLAATIEAFLRNEVDYLPFEKINDMDERTTPVQGGDYFLVEWDNNRNSHRTRGDLKVTLLHPRQVVPQAGVNDIQSMDYIFTMIGTTKKDIKNAYGVDVFDETEEFPEIRSNGGTDTQNSNDMVTLITAYYKNDNGSIGVFRWVGDTVVQDLPHYYARRLRHCKKCGAVVNEGEKTCPVCGSKAIEYQEQTTTPLDRNIEIRGMNGFETIQQMTNARYADSPMLDETGDFMRDEMGQPIYEMLEPEHPTEVPIYELTQFPIVLRRNISKSSSLLGYSDVDAIKDQQEIIKKLGAKIQTKLMKGGSVAIFPDSVNAKLSDEELNVVKIHDAAENSMIRVLNLQPDINNDMIMFNEAYQAARNQIGITDSFQGRRDTTAQSGKAKEFAAAQTAGRLESKRVMKSATYQDVYQLMFKMALAYADEPRPTNKRDSIGDVEYGIFDRYKFLERDSAGELYWNDDFLFSVDTTSNMAQNREALWNSTKEAYQSGAFGNPQEIDTRILYWASLEKYHYPNAGNVLQNLKDQKDRLEAQQNEMREMQLRNGNLQGGAVGGQPVPPNIPVPQPFMQ